MAKRRKRRKPRPTDNQTHVLKKTPTEYSQHESGAMLKKTRHTLSHKTDFLDLWMLIFKDKPVHHSEGTLADKTAYALREKAEYVINNWDCDWQAVEAYHAALLESHDFETGWNWNCAEIYNDFSYQKMRQIHLYEAMHVTDDGEQTLSLFIQDGNHRCLALACLLLQEKIKWQPIPYWLWTIDAQVPQTPHQRQKGLTHERSKPL